MSPAVMTRVLALLSEAEAAMRNDPLTPADRGIALGCLTSARAHVEAAIEVEATLFEDALRILNRNTYEAMGQARKLLDVGIRTASK